MVNFEEINKKSLSLIISCIFIFSYFGKNTSLAYIFSVLVFMFVLFDLLVSGRKLKIELIIISLFLLIIQIVYFLKGNINGAPLVDSIRNFSGFYLFPFFFIAFYSMRVYKIEVPKIVTKTLIISLPFLLLQYYYKPNFSAGETVADISELRSIYSIASFLLCGYCLILLCDYKSNVYRRYNNFSHYYMLAALCLISVAALLLSFSKVVLVFLFALILYVLIRYFFLWFIWLSVYLAFFYFSEINDYLEILISGYNFKSEGNTLRFEQASHLINGLSLFGSGLGVPLESFSRRTQGYGFELSYLNIMHKYGIFSLLYFFLFFTPIIIVAKRYLFNTIRKYDQAYLHVSPLILASFMNPFISHPIIILLVSYWWVEYRYDQKIDHSSYKSHRE
jgi:hypothetical protein